MHRFELKVEYFLKKEINELFIMNALRSFALSTISIFIPIFLLKKGYSLFQVAFYLMLWAMIGIFVSYSALKLAAKKGVKHMLVVSIPLMILFFISLYNLDVLREILGNFATLVLIAALQAVQGEFYFMGFHLDFAKITKIEMSTRQLGIISATATVFSIIGPIVGSLIITTFSFNVLFIFVILISIISGIPLFFSRELHEPFEFNLKKVLKSFGKNNSFSFFAEGVRGVAAVYFWPILFYFTVTNLNTIGGAYTLSNLMVALFTFYIGKKATELNKKKILKFGAYIHSLTLVVRTIVKTVLMITVVQGFGGLSWAMLNLPYRSIFYNNSKRIGIAYMVYYRELFLMAGRFFGILILTLLLLIFRPVTSLIVSIIVGALAVFIMMLIRDEGIQVPAS